MGDIIRFKTTSLYGTNRTPIVTRFNYLTGMRRPQKSLVRVNFSCLLAAPFLVGLHAHSKGTQFPE